MAWQRVAVLVAGADVARFTDALEDEGALSVDVADADAGSPDEEAVFGEPGSEASVWKRCRVRALFDASIDVSAALEGAMAEANVVELEAASLDRLEDSDWVAETQRQFAPIAAGRRIWIVPTWHKAPDPDAINIALDPGAAFGTGSHPTTRLCLAWLEENVKRTSTVLDYGCGSGILGIAALMLGARAATGVDIDPLALEAARYNARRNDVALEVAAAAEPLAPQLVTITIANILANPLRVLAPVLAARTEPGGAIALSGILATQADEVAGAYAPWADMHVAGSESEWVLLAGRRIPTAC
jgi:ribosomal protein L11 methyltransferase